MHRCAILMISGSRYAAWPVYVKCITHGSERRTSYAPLGIFRIASRCKTSMVEGIDGALALAGHASGFFRCRAAFEFHQGRGRTAFDPECDQPSGARARGGAWRPPVQPTHAPPR